MGMFEEDILSTSGGDDEKEYEPVNLEKVVKELENKGVSRIEIENLALGHGYSFINLTKTSRRLSGAIDFFWPIVLSGGGYYLMDKLTDSKNLIDAIGKISVPLLIGTAAYLGEKNLIAKEKAKFYHEILKKEYKLEEK
jgi:hypothetical protein